MLYVGCSVCQHVGPLLCAGSFPPHTVRPAIPGPMGAICPTCGPMLPWFGCWRCGTRQMMFFPTSHTALPSQPVPPVGPGALPRLAPVIQAEAGLSGAQLATLFGKTIGEFCTRHNGQLGPELTGALSSWTGGFEGAWQ